MSDTLQGFIRHARGKGLDHVTIRQLLLASGWKEKDIARAIAAEGLDIGVPEPAGGNARESFIYLMSFASLYVVVAGVISLYYIFLDSLYPDPAWSNVNVEWVLDNVRYAIASVVVAFPVFLALSLVLERIVQKTRDNQRPPVARWLTYLTMFLAAAVLMGDLITLLYYFLDGALTTRFVLKVVVLLVIAEVVLSYYYLAPSGLAKGASTAWLRRALSGAGVLIVAGAIVLGFSLAGSPFSAREVRLDEQRIADLRAIHDAVQHMTTEEVKHKIKVKRPLPKTLEEINDFQKSRESVKALNLADPVTGEKYGYNVTGEKTYELCAEFVRPRDKKDDLFWNHRAGKHCFKFNAETPP